MVGLVGIDVLLWVVGSRCRCSWTLPSRFCRVVDRMVASGRSCGLGLEVGFVMKPMFLVASRWGGRRCGSHCGPRRSLFAFLRRPCGLVSGIRW